MVNSVRMCVVEIVADYAGLRVDIEGMGGVFPSGNMGYATVDRV
jgi:hypothetical protein